MTGPLPEHSIYPTAEISPNSLDGRTGICLVFFIYIYVKFVHFYGACLLGPTNPKKEVLHKIGLCFGASDLSHTFLLLFRPSSLSLSLKSYYYQFLALKSKSCELFSFGWYSKEKNKKKKKNKKKVNSENSKLFPRPFDSINIHQLVLGFCIWDGLFCFALLFLFFFYQYLFGLFLNKFVFNYFSVRRKGYSIVFAFLDMGSFFNFFLVENEFYWFFDSGPRVTALSPNQFCVWFLGKY